MNFLEVHSTISRDEDTCIDWLMSKGLICSAMNCKKCGTGCNVVLKKGVKVWRCPNRGCQSVCSLRMNSFFSGSHLKLHEIINIIYWWSAKSTVTSTMKETGAHKRTISIINMIPYKSHSHGILISFYFISIYPILHYPPLILSRSLRSLANKQTSPIFNCVTPVSVSLATLARQSGY